MKVKIRSKDIDVEYIREEYIKLDSLLKFANIVESGGFAKQLILDGEVEVNGEVCTQRGKKIREGDIVKCAGQLITVKRAE